MKAGWRGMEAGGRRDGDEGGTEMRRGRKGWMLEGSY